MLYVFYRHRHEPARELVMRDGAEFPRHLRQGEWYLHATHATVNGRTEADIATLGFCDRNGGAGVTFGRNVAAKPHPEIARKSSP